MEQNPLKRNLISFLIALSLSFLAISLSDNDLRDLKKKKHVGNEINQTDSHHTTASFFFD